MYVCLIKHISRNSERHSHPNTFMTNIREYIIHFHHNINGYQLLSICCKLGIIGNILHLLFSISLRILQWRIMLILEMEKLSLREVKYLIQAKAKKWCIYGWKCGPSVSTMIGYIRNNRYTSSIFLSHIYYCFKGLSLN